MRIKLYEDISTNKILTYEDVKQQYAESVGADLPIDDDTMSLIIMSELVQNGGNIRLISEQEDKVLKWCNDYLEYNEAERYLNQEECDLSIRNIYQSILCEDRYILNEVAGVLKNDSKSVPGAADLLERLVWLMLENDGAPKDVWEKYCTDLDNGRRNIATKGKTIIFFDTETTGFSSRQNQIIQISAMKVDSETWSVLDTFNVYIQCPEGVPQPITELTGITDELLNEKGVSEKEAFSRVAEFFTEDCILAAYNLPFDEKFLRMLYARNDADFCFKGGLDVLEMVRELIPENELPVVDNKVTRKLSAVTQKLGIAGGFNYHSADDDTKAMFFVFQKLIRK